MREDRLSFARLYARCCRKGALRKHRVGGRKQLGQHPHQQGHALQDRSCVSAEFTSLSLFFFFSFSLSLSHTHDVNTSTPDSYLKCPVEDIKQTLLHILSGLFIHIPALRILDNPSANPSLFNKTLLGGFVAMLAQVADKEEEPGTDDENEEEEKTRLVNFAASRSQDTEMVLQILLGTMYTKDGLVHADRLHHAVAYGMVPVLVGLLLDDVEDVQDIDLNNFVKKSALELLLLVGQAKRRETRMALRTVKAQRSLLKLVFRLVLDLKQLNKAISFISVWLLKDKSKSAELFISGRCSTLIEASMLACDRMEHSDDAEAGQALNVVAQILHASPPLARGFEKNKSFVHGLFDFLTDDRSRT